MGATFAYAVKLTSRTIGDEWKQIPYKSMNTRCTLHESQFDAQSGPTESSVEKAD